MKVLKNVLFYVALMALILVTIWCFNYAHEFRNSNQIGSEVFVLALPLMLVEYKMNRAEQKITKLKKRNRMLRKCM